MHGQVQKLVIAISSVEGKSVLERWVFDVDTDREVASDGPGREKSQQEITNEIQAIIRQITASVTFLPLINEPCTFEMLVYTDLDTDVPQSWEESDPKYITNAAEVRMRSFSTKVHKVDTLVAYKVDE